MNTVQQDALTLRRITVWSELFRIGYGTRRPDMDSLSTDERSLLNDLTQTLHADLIYGKHKVSPAGLLTVEDAVAYAMNELFGNNAEYFRPINAAGGPITTIPRRRVEEIIRVACTGIASKDRL